MDKWPYPVRSWERHTIQEAVDSVTWQAFRRSLKGLSTEEKLDKLLGYWKRLGKDEGDGNIGLIPVEAIVRVDNYINALKRGGQLDLEGNVQR